MMTTEHLLEAIELVETSIEEAKIKMKKLESEIERKKMLMENINFDYKNLYTISNEISNDYYDLYRLENKIEVKTEELNRYYKLLQTSVTFEEYNETLKNKEIENLKNMNKNLIEIKEIFENEFENIEIKSNEICFSKINRNSRIWVRIKLLDDNSYQYTSNEKTVNVKRKNTIIKYIQEFLIKAR